MKIIRTIILITLITIISMCNICFAQYSKLFDFFSTTTGSNADGDLISDGIFLYGTTAYGGANNFGTVFKIKTDGTGYVKLFDFSGAADGSKPLGSLVYDGTFLYGMTWEGGTSNFGVIYKIKPDGTGYSKILDFVGANGKNPKGSFIFDGTFLYGMTKLGGNNGYGVIFKILPNGSGYTKLLDFNYTNGAYSDGSLISDGIYLYGMTKQGGINGYGVIFKILLNGTGYTKLLDFAGSSNGSNPSGSLFSDGTFLYGMTFDGGTNNYGVLFKIKPDGTGYTKLLDFAGASNGRNPFFGALISDGTFLYGMTPQGGTSDLGVIFKIKFDGTGFSKLLDFIGTINGSAPQCSLYSDGTSLYGKTEQGGIYGNGVIFKFGIVTGINENNESIDFNLFPNPTRGKFNLIMNNKLGALDYEVGIYNMFGERIYSTTNIRQNNTLEIDISSFPSGMYFVNFNDEDNIYVKIIVKQ